MSKRKNLKNAILLTLFFTFLLVTTVMSVKAADGVTWTGNEWSGVVGDDVYPNRSCDIVQIGREAPRTDSIPYETFDKAKSGAEDYAKEASEYITYISRTDWSFKLFDSPSAFDAGDSTEFYKPTFDVSSWDKLYVPMSWQNAGYDKPLYHARGGAYFGNFGNPGKVTFGDGISSMPLAPTVYNPIGLYRHTFTVPENWDGNRIFINFEGVKTAYYLWINGIQVGYAEDSFTSDEFDVTDYVIPGQENVIALKVYRWADASWLEDQDMIDLSGIFRDVYLYTTPNVRVRDYEITTDFDSTFTDSNLIFDVELKNYKDTAETANVKFRLLDADGNEIALTNNTLSEELAAGEKKSFELNIPVTAPRKWSTEDPYLYTAIIEENLDGKTVYESYLVGFRKITYKTNDSGQWEGTTTDHDLIRINGKAIMFRGVNRHDTDPEYGNAVRREYLIRDVQLMKENNINAVRTSHYSDDPYFLYLCDVYGIYVLSEANQENHRWYDEIHQTDNPRWDDTTVYFTDAIVDREWNMVERDKNHSSIVMWSLGNESCNPTILQKVLVNPYKTQTGETLVLRDHTKSRAWHYEGLSDMSSGIDVRSSMYGGPDRLQINASNNAGAIPFIKCEYSHSMGNAGGNFFKFWDLFENYRNLQGGFVWDFIDQTVKINYTEAQTTVKLSSKHDENLVVPTANCSLETVDGKKALSGYAIFPDSSDVNVTGNGLTIDVVAMFNTVDTTSEVNWDMISKGDHQFLLKVRKYNNSTNYMLQFALYDSVNKKWVEANYKFSGTDVAGFMDHWHRITATYDGTTMTLYYDGEKKAENTMTSGITQYSHNFALNYNTEKNLRSDSYISSVRIFNKAKTISELDSIKPNDDSCVLWMDMAEDYEITETPAYSYDSYGGDWGETTSGGSFCQNGIVNPDRTPQPELFEIKKQHSEIKIKEIDAQKGEFTVENHLLFTDISKHYEISWKLLQNNEEIDSGVISPELLNAPTVDINGFAGKVNIKIPYKFDETKIIPGSEYLLDIRVTLKEDENYLKKGYEINRDQFKINYVSAERPKVNAVSDMTDMSLTDNGEKVTLTGADFVVEFSKTSGRMITYKAKNGEGVLCDLIVSGKGPEGSFYRAPTTNDRSEPVINAIATEIKNHGAMTLSSFTVDSTNPKAVKIKASGSYAKVNGLEIENSYTVYANGQVRVDSKITPKYNDTISLIPIVGMQLNLPSGFENIEFYGKGPFENYIDRNMAAAVGIYETTVTDNFIGYMRPGENGNRTEVRYVKITDDDGFGLLAKANDAPIEFSALHYEPSALNNARHPHELSKTEETVLRLNAMQLGIGGDTCSAGGYIADEEYRPTSETFEYSYTLSPILAGDDAMDIYLTDNEEEPSREYLKAAVDTAKTYKAEGYTKGSFESLTEAIESAQAIIDSDENFDYTVLDEAQSNVVTAIEGLVSISDAIDTFDKVGDYDPSEYTYESYNELFKAAIALDKVINEYAPTKEAVENATNAVLTAIEGLDKLEGEDTTKPEGAVDVLELFYTVLNTERAENSSDRSRLSVYNYNKTLDDAFKLTKNAASQAQVDEMLEKVLSIEDLLEESDIGISEDLLIDVSGSGYKKFGTEPCYKAGYEYYKVFDGNTSTFFDYINRNDGYSGVDLGEGSDIVIGAARVYPRPGTSSNASVYYSRVKLAMLQGSNDMETWTTLFTIEETPTTSYVDFVFENHESYRYIRYYSPDGWCNVAEVMLYRAAADTSLLEYAITEAEESGFEGDELTSAKASLSSDQATVDASANALLLALENKTVTVSCSIKLERAFENSCYDDPVTNYSSAAVITVSGNGETFTISEKDMTKSESNGNTVLSFPFDLGDGDYSITVTKNGYLTYSGAFSVSNAEAICDITLIPGDIKDSYDAECGDGIVDIDDFIRILRGFNSNSEVALRQVVDINEDGTVSVTDLGYIKTNLGKAVTR